MDMDMEGTVVVQWKIFNTNMVFLRLEGLVLAQSRTFQDIQYCNIILFYNIQYQHSKGVLLGWGLP